MAAILALSGDLGSSRHTLSLVRCLLSWISLDSHQMDVIHWYFRKGGHIACYATLYFLWFRAFAGNLHYSLRKSILWSLWLCLMLALVDEGHQALLNSRRGSLTDVALDLGAAVMSAVATSIFWTVRLRRSLSQG
jgi:VanZ family protein